MQTETVINCSTILTSSGHYHGVLLSRNRAPIVSSGEPPTEQRRAPDKRRARARAPAAEGVRPRASGAAAAAVEIRRVRLDAFPQRGGEGEREGEGGASPLTIEALIRGRPRSWARRLSDLRFSLRAPAANPLGDGLSRKCCYDLFPGYAELAVEWELFKRVIAYPRRN